MEDKDIVRIHFTGWRDGKWIGSSAQQMPLKVYEDFVEKLSEEDKLIVYRLLFYYDHGLGEHPNKQGADIDEFKIATVQKGGPFLPIRMD